ncbi:MAG: hypothetical protein F4Z33_06665 [Gemmatimonadales bacterium]|nr:hypothetical protein [Gemmatimonadales bacterium]
MSFKRFLAAAAFAVILAVVPVTADADAPAGLGLSSASCTEEGCGSISKVDCICPDMQERNRKPRCVEP